MKGWEIQMSLTLTLHGVEDSVSITDVDILRISEAEWSLVNDGFKQRPDGTSGVVYINTTTPNGVMTLTSTTRISPKEGVVGVRRARVRLATKVKVENSVSGAITTYPIAGELLLELPLLDDLTATEVSQFVQNLIGTVLQSATSGAAETVTIGRMLIGQTAII